MPTVPLDSVLQLLRAHKILTNLWAMTGTQRVTSKQDPSVQVLEAPYEDCLRYHTFVEAKIQEHPAYLAGDMATVVQWALDRDRRTRVTARALYNGGQFSWGEALAQAMKDNGVIWTVTEMGVTVLPPSSEEQGDQLPHPPQPAKGQPGQRGGTVQSKQRQPHQASQQQQRSGKFSAPSLCRDWNSHRGCTLKQKDCPHGAGHACSYRLSGGNICNNWNHNYVTHKKWEENDGSSKSCKRSRGF